MKKYLVILTAVTLLGAGCSTSTTPSTNSPQIAIDQTAIDPESRCDALMTLNEAAQVSGLSYSKRDASAQAMGTIVVTTCTYSNNDRTSGIKLFSVLTRYASSVDEAKTIFEASKSAPYTDGQALSGIGDQALWSPSFGQVSVLQGQTWLIVTANKNQDLATKIAKTIAPKLK